MERYRFWRGLCQGLAHHILLWPGDVARRDARYDCFCGWLVRFPVIVPAVFNKNIPAYTCTSASQHLLGGHRFTRDIGQGVN